MANQNVEPTMTAHEEIEDSPKEHLDANGPRVVRTLLVPWVTRWTFLELLMGHEEGNVYYLPQKCPYNEALRARKINSIKGWGEETQTSDGQSRQWEYAEIEVEYARLSTGSQENEDQSEVYVTEDIEPSTEFIMVPEKPDDPTTRLYWDLFGEEPLGTDQKPGGMLYSCTWVYKRNRVATLSSEIITMVGTVNNAPVKSNTLNHTFETETLLYNPPHLERQITSEGIQRWNVTLRFTYRPNRDIADVARGWNYFPRVLTASGGRINYEPVYLSDATEFKLYKPEDFTKLVVRG